MREKSAQFKQGLACYKNVSLVDIFPTLTELCGLESKPALTGNSLVPLLKDPQRERWDHPILTVLRDNHYSIRKDHWHYILYEGVEQELYDLKKDPEEWTNLAGQSQYAKLIQTLRQSLPKKRKPNIKTKPIRWADVLSGTTRFYE